MTAAKAAIRIGRVAPAFSLQTGDGRTVRLSDLRGKRVVLYFYPKDDTPGCTREACDFRDRSAELEGLNAIVLGVSPDSVDSHRKFSEKFGLSFPLLSDPGAALSKAYGVYKQKQLYGRTYMGIERTTFIIDERGKIAAIFPKVKVDRHAQAVREALDRLGAEDPASAS